MKDIDLYTVKMKTDSDAFELYVRTEPGVDSILLDSSKKDSAFSKYSLFGVNPFLSVKYENGKIYQKEGECWLEEDRKGNIFDYLDALLKEYRVETVNDLPFVGGAIGYFSYDLAWELEHLLVQNPDSLSIPDCYFVFYDNAVILNHNSCEVTITGLGILKNSESSVHEIKERMIKRKKQIQMKTMQQKKAVFQSPFTREDYIEAIETLRQYIENGHIYIANMTHTFWADYNQDALAAYKRLREVNPAPFSAYMPLDGFQVLCSSPERFIEIRDREVQTRPIKGTRPRGKTLEEDAFYRAELELSEKDRSELLMIVDLERNDLSKVCKPGTVEVTELFKIEAYETVFHLVSTIEGRLKDSVSAVECLKAVFPGGSITGAPKIRAMEIIEELEKSKRSLYTGCIGYVSFDGQADFNIVIRTAILKDQKAFVGVGGGITWESKAADEYQETLDKAKALFRALDAHFG